MEYNPFTRPMVPSATSNLLLEKTKRDLLHFEFQMLVKGSSGTCKEQLKLGDIKTK